MENSKNKDSEQDLYEIKGELSLLRKGLFEWLKEIAYLLFFIFLALLYIASK